MNPFEIGTGRFRIVCSRDMEDDDAPLAASWTELEPIMEHDWLAPFRVARIGPDHPAAL